MTDFGKALWIAYVVVIVCVLLAQIWRSAGEE